MKKVNNPQGSKRVGSYEAKTKLPSLLDQVSKGSSFTITKRGQPVALLTPILPNSLETLDEAVEAIKQLRKQYSLHGLSIKKLSADGRK